MICRNLMQENLQKHYFPNVFIKGRRAIVDLDKENLVKILWDYHHMNHTLNNADCIIAFGSHDTRVAVRAAELYNSGYSGLIIFSGGFGKLTKHLWNSPEADKFSEIAVNMHVPKNKILIENKSSNTGENVLFTKSLVESSNINIRSAIIVNKPYMERRSYAAIKKLWPEIDIIVTSPQLSLDEYLESYSSGEITKDEIISMMVGDLQRIKLYPEKGFQIEQIIPQNVWQAFDELVEMGYTRHLI